MREILPTAWFARLADSVDDWRLNCLVQHCNSRFGMAPSYALEASYGDLHLFKHCEKVEEGMSRASDVMLALSD